MTAAMAFRLTSGDNRRFIAAARFRREQKFLMTYHALGSLPSKRLICC